VATIVCLQAIWTTIVPEPNVFLGINVGPFIII